MATEDGEASASKRRRLLVGLTQGIQSAFGPVAAAAAAAMAALVCEEAAKLEAEKEQLRAQVDFLESQLMEAEAKLGASDAENERLKDGVVASETQPKCAPLPDELWLKVLMDVRQIDLLAFVSTCKQLRRVQVASNRELVIKVKENDFYDTRVELSEWALMQLSAKARTEFAKRRQLISSCAALPGNLKVL